MTNYLFSADNEKPTFQGSWEAWAGDHIYSFIWYQYKNNFNADKSFAPSGDYTLFWFAELNAKKNFSESFDIYARYDLVSSSGIADNQFVIGMEKRF